MTKHKKKVQIFFIYTNGHHETHSFHLFFHLHCDHNHYFVEQVLSSDDLNELPSGPCVQVPNTYICVRFLFCYCCWSSFSFSFFFLYINSSGKIQIEHFSYSIDCYANANDFILTIANEKQLITNYKLNEYTISTFFSLWPMPKKKKKNMKNTYQKHNDNRKIHFVVVHKWNKKKWFIETMLYCEQLNIV